MEHECQHDQLWLPQLSEQAGEPLATRRLGVGQIGEIPDGLECVFVDGVFVVKIADHATVNLPELREHPSQESVLVHLREPAIEPGLRRQKMQKLVAFIGTVEEFL